MKQKTILTLALTMGLAALATAAIAWPGVFVPATTLNTSAVVGGAWSSDTDADNYDNLWGWDPADMAWHSYGSWHENTPQLVTTVTDLPSGDYDVYVVFDAVYNGGLSIQADLTQADTLPTVYWDSPNTVQEYENVAIYSHKLGTVANATQLSVYVDDGNYTFGQGSRYLGVVYYQIPPLNLDGTVIFADQTDDPGRIGFVVDFIQGGVVTQTAKVFPDSSGNFTIPDVTEGTFDIRFSAHGWLQKLVTNVIVAQGVNLNVVFDINGDIDGDNEITSTDLSILGLNLGLAGD